MSALFFLPRYGDANAFPAEFHLPTASSVMGFVSPLLTLCRLCSKFVFRVLEPGSRSCQVRGVRTAGHKTAQADAGNIDKGLTLKP